MVKIESFTISRLHNQAYDISIRFKDNILVLVGENGSGKTTILQCFFYTLTQQWAKLLHFNFHSISITIDNREFTFLREELENFFMKQTRSLSLLPSSILKKLTTLSINKPLSINELEHYSEMFHIPLPFIESAQKEYFRKLKALPQLKELQEYINEKFNFLFLYLPTYRRIEKELQSIFKGLDDSDVKKFYLKRSITDKTNFLEMIEFGMNDVSHHINDTLLKLNNFTRENLNSLTSVYLADIIDKKYDNKNIIFSIKSLDSKSIDSVLDRIGSDILSDQNKIKLRDIISKLKKSDKLSEHENIICHYFIKLINFQNELLEKELDIINFCKICNKYLVDKEIIYDSKDFKIQITFKGSNNNNLKYNENYLIKLQNLSSGEKQIVSIFSHILLSGLGDFFVLIDEPELSLSVEWQKEFLLDIYNTKSCRGIFAVTHSPFICDNKLMSYARGINSFGVSHGK